MKNRNYSSLQWLISLSSFGLWQCLINASIYLNKCFYLLIAYPHSIEGGCGQFLLFHFYNNTYLLHYIPNCTISLTQDFTKTTKEFHLKFEKILNTLSSTWTLACYRSMTGFYHFQFLHTKGQSGAAFSRHSPNSLETPCMLQRTAAYQCAGTLFLHFNPLITKFINLTSTITLNSLQAQGHCPFTGCFLEGYWLLYRQL